MENILLGKNFKVKIADFGLANDPSKCENQKMGTPLYMAPEIANSKSNFEYTDKVDVYALGIHFFKPITRII